jgi:hypothetical protein
MTQRLVLRILVSLQFLDIRVVLLISPCYMRRRCHDVTVVTKSRFLFAAGWVNAGTMSSRLSISARSALGKWSASRVPLQSGPSQRFELDGHAEISPALDKVTF